MIKAFIEIEIKAKQNKAGFKEYDFSSADWEPEWLSVRGRREGYISRETGKLILRPSADKLNDAESDNEAVAEVAVYSFGAGS